MIIASWNVNGIRACVKKGFFDWVKKLKPDIIALQETKAQDDQVEEALSPLLNTYDLFTSSAERKGYSGVAILKKKKQKFFAVTNMGAKKFDQEGRTLIAELEDFYFINCYFPNGGRDHSRVPYKLDFCKTIERKMKKLNKPILICGDYNTAHQEIDLKNPKQNHNTTGFLPVERKWMDQYIKKGQVDLFREFHPEEEGHYTWWSYRGDCRERNIGWRIDYFFCSEDFVSQVKSVKIQPEILGSDHCPLYCKLRV